MFFTIEYDSRKVIFTSGDRSPVDKFIFENRLGAQVAVVESQKDVERMFSLRELNGIYNTALKETMSFSSMEKAVKEVWEMLDHFKESFPLFNTNSAKRMFKNASKEDKLPTRKKGKPVTRVDSNKLTKRSPTGKPRTKSDAQLGLDTEPKPNTKLHTVWTMVEDALGEIKFDELVEMIKEQENIEEKLARRYVNKSIRKNHLKIVA